MVLPFRVERPFTPRSLHRRHPRPILGVVALGTAALVLLLGGGVGATAAGPGTIEVNVDTAKTGAKIEPQSLPPVRRAPRHRHLRA